MKAYTDLDQSKKLAEILPIESANIILILENSELTTYPIMRNYSEFYNFLRKFEFEEEHIKRMYIPAWSLVALMDVLDRGASFKTSQGWACQAYIGSKAITSNYHSNPVDACVEMIKKLHELKLL